MYIILTLDWLFFGVLGLTTLYLFVFSLFSLKKTKLQIKKSSQQSKFVVLFPAYMEDEVIVKSINSFQDQTYDKSNYKVVVIADKLQDETISQLEPFDIDILQVNFENSTKAKALNHAMLQLDTDSFDVVVILDADNEVEASFLEDINDAYQSGFKVIQAHRVAKNYNTSTAILDAISEEINNSIFRKGHVNAGLSSALIGSGIAFDINCFIKLIKNVTSVGEDKELELALHTENIFIQYFENIYVYDIKTDTNAGFQKQRQRWLSAQFQMLTVAIKQLNRVYKLVSWDYWDKLFQWTMLPRVLAYISILILAVFTSFFFPVLALKWWLLFLLFSLAMFFAIPGRLYNIQLLKAIPNIPILCVMMFLNLFQLKKGAKEFIHTKHSKH